jgi:hypothetical protein
MTSRKVAHGGGADTCPVPRRPRKTRVARQQRGAEGLRESNVHGVVGREVRSQLPDADNEHVVGEARQLRIRPGSRASDSRRAGRWLTPSQGESVTIPGHTATLPLSVDVIMNACPFPIPAVVTVIVRCSFSPLTPDVRSQANDIDGVIP